MVVVFSVVLLRTVAIARRCTLRKRDICVTNVVFASSRRVLSYCFLDDFSMSFNFMVGVSRTLHATLFVSVTFVPFKCEPPSSYSDSNLKYTIKGLPSTDLSYFEHATWLVFHRHQWS